MTAQALLIVATAAASAQKVLNDTDFPSNCYPNPYAPSTSIEMCAALCTKRADCVATIFAPGVAPACAFKCRSDNPVHKVGITAIIVRPGHKSTCVVPPPGPAPPAPPAPFTPPSAATDPDWLVRYECANLLHADGTLSSSLFPYIGNGYLATHPVASSAGEMDTMYVSGVFNGIAVQSPCEGGYCTAPYRAAIPTYRAVLTGAPLLIGRFALDVSTHRHGCKPGRSGLYRPHCGQIY
jgi:hypothetical protein